MKVTLKATRINNNMTQEEAAEKIGVSRCTLANWENMKTFPNAEQIKKIESIYSVSYDDIIFFQ